MRNEQRLATLGGTLGILGGLWLIASPFVLGYNTIGDVMLTIHGASVVQDASSAPYVTYIGGVIILALVVFSLITARIPRFRSYRIYAAAAAILTGIGLMAQPYFSEYDGVRTPLYNLQLTGATIIIIAGFVVETVSKTKSDVLARA